jgi:hypothetical protein
MKPNLYILIAELVGMLLDYGASQKSIVQTLVYYGITKKQAKEWYNINDKD